MIKKPWTAQEVTYLIKEFGNGIKTINIARALGRTHASLDGKLRELAVSGQIERVWGRHNHNQTEAAEFKPVPEKLYNDFISIEADTINISDVHVPFQHRKLFDYYTELAKKFKIGTLIINGDFLNNDAFSRWPTGFHGETNAMYELKSAAHFLAQALKTFKTIYITQGNHEDRLTKALQMQIPASSWFRMIHDQIGHFGEKGKRIIVSDYPYIEVNRSWRIVHPKNYGSRGGTVPADIADCEGMNVISGHNHQWGLQVSKNGRYVGIDHGMAGDPEQIEYYKKSVTTGRKWQVGFSMILHNKGYAFNFEHTDWKYWLK